MFWVGGSAYYGRVGYHGGGLTYHGGGFFYPDPLKNDWEFEDSFLHFFYMTCGNSFFAVVFSKYARMLAACVAG